MSFRSSAPPTKRIKLESSPTPSLEQPEHFNIPISAEGPPEDLNEDHCSICLQQIVDRTVIPICAHEFCFECLLVWSEQSRRCPLCSQSIGEYLIHHVRSKYDYQKHYLAPLRTSPAPLPPLARAHQARNTQRNTRRSAREREWGRRERREREETDRLDRAIARRRWIYDHDLYAKHVASNSYTRYRPYPSPAQFSSSTELISRTTSFLRRELRVWVNLDVEFLTTFIISLMKAIDIRSESAVKLLAEFLDMDAPYVEGGRHVNAEHFAHEVYCYVRSPYKDLFVYDTIVQYETPPEIPPPPEQPTSRRWRASYSRSRSPRSYLTRDQRAVSRSSSRSPSWSPSGRRYSSRERRLDEHGDPSSHRKLSRSCGGSRSRSRSQNQDLLNEGFLRDGHKLHDYRNNGIRAGEENKEYARGSGKSRLDEVGDVRGSRDVKGKRKAEIVDDEESGGVIKDLLCHPSLTQTEIQLSNAPNSDHVKCQVDDQPKGGTLLAHPTPNQPNPKAADHRRPPRNRNLLESVHAHLASGARTRSNTDVKEKNSLRSGQPSSASSLPRQSDAPPSLLQRLSEPDIDRAPSLATRAPTPPRNSDELIPFKKLDGNKGTLSKIQTKMSAPDIMTRTHARMEKPMDEAMPLTFPSNPSGETDIPPSLCDHQDTSTTSAPEIMVHTRARLAKSNETASGALPSSLHPIAGAQDISVPSKPKMSTSARDIMARTRARLAMLTHSSDRLSCAAPSALGYDKDIPIPENISLVGSRSNSPTDGNQNHDNSPLGSTSFPTAESTSASDMRTRLLHRLEEEKKQVKGAQLLTSVTSLATPFPVVSVLDSSSPASDMRSTASNNESPTPYMSVSIPTPKIVSDIPGDSQTMEAKLRARAQLRVRLAAAKRSGGGVLPASLGSQSMHGNGSDGGRNSSEESTGSGARERMLRTTLRNQRL